MNSDHTKIEPLTRASVLRDIVQALGQETEVVGLAVVHKGTAMRLYPPDDAADPRWTATCDAADHDGGQAAGGYGDDPMEALDACAADVATQAAARRRLDEENDA